jgi:hypothetical protein
VIGWIICRRISESSALADKLQTIVELDLEELQTVDLPGGYGRD